MATLTIAEERVTNYQEDSASATLRIYCSEDFTDEDGFRHVFGNPNSGRNADFFLEVPCTIDGELITIPEFQHPIPTNQYLQVRFTAVLFDANNRQMNIHVLEYRLPENQTEQTWEQIRIHNAARYFPRTFSRYLNQDQTQQLITEQINNIVLDDATTTDAGLTKLTKGTGFDGAVGAIDAVYLEAKQSAFLSDFASVSAALSSLGSSTKRRFVLDNDLTVSANTTFTENLRVSISPDTLITINNGITLTIENGQAFDASPNQQVFNCVGTGKIIFTKSLPELFRAEWFGAKGDNTTDDLTAFQKCLDSMQILNTLHSNKYIGGIIQTSFGRNYYFSDTLDVRRPVLIRGGFGDYNQPFSTLRFPANTTGLIFHGASTVDGVASATETGMMGGVEGVAIVGAIGGNNSEVSTNGLELEITGGTISAVSQRGLNDNSEAVLAPGSTVTINGYTYCVDFALSRTTTTTVPIQYPRSLVSATNGSPTLTLGDYSSLPSNNDWAGATLNIGGVNYTISSHTASAITLSGNFTGTTGLYTATNTTGLKVMSGQNARFNIYHGIDARIQIKLKNTVVRTFAGNGVDIHSERYPSAFLGTEPNGNNCEFTRLHVLENAGAGLNLFGVNSNNLTIIGLNAENNLGYGIHEEGTLGANYFAMHNAFNHRGAFRMVGLVAQNELHACYTESGQPSGLTGQSTRVIGGNIASDLDRNFGDSQSITSFSGDMVVQSALAFMRSTGYFRSINNPKAVRAQLGHLNQPSIMLGFGAGEEAVNTGAGYAATIAGIATYLLGYDHLATGWYSLFFGGNYADQSKAVLAFSGSNASVGGGKLALPTGFRVRLTDTQTNGIRHGVATLSGGTVTVADTTITANSRILLTPQDTNTAGALKISARIVSTSFTITSSNAGDSGVVAYTIIEP